MTFVKTTIAAAIAGILLVTGRPVSAAPDGVASKNINDVMKGLKASKFKYKADSNPCISDTFCTVMVGHTQINTYGGGAVDVMTSAEVPDARYIVVCAAALAGLANIDPMTASSLFGEGLAKGRLKVGDVLLNTQTRQDGKVSCNLYRKRINPKG